MTTSQAFNTFFPNFGVRLRTARKARDYSQVQLSHLTGIGQDTISHYECGRSVPCLDRIAALSEALSVPIHYFLREDTLQHDDHPEQLTWELFIMLSPLFRDFLRQFIRHTLKLQGRRHFLAQKLNDDPQRLRRILENDLIDLQSENDPDTQVSVQSLAIFTSLAIIGLDWELQDMLSVLSPLWDRQRMEDQ